MSEPPNLKNKLGHIEALIKEAETLQDTSRQRECIPRIKELISEAKTNLLDVETKHGDNPETLELGCLWASLDHATFNTNMMFMAPYKEKLDIYRY